MYRELNPATGEVTVTPKTDLVPRQLTVAADGDIWFTARFTPQGVGRLVPASGEVPAVVTEFPLTNVGPEGIAASPEPNGPVWFTPDHQGEHSPDRGRWCHNRGQGRQGQRAIWHHGHTRRRPLVHDVRGEQDRHLTVEVDGEGTELVRRAPTLTLIHPGVPWPGKGHPEAMKMSCR